jgi:hypothetical protein
MLSLNLKDRIQIYQLVAGLTAVTLILIGCLIILTPFFPAMLLSTIFTLATWPAFMWLNNRVSGHLLYRPALHHRHERRG